MIISISGYGFSGASGFIDLLKEYEDVQFFNKPGFEFQILKAPDGLLDLYYSVVERNGFLSENAGIKRFLRMAKENNYFSPNAKLKKAFKMATYDFINNIDIISWKGRSVYDPKDLKSLFGKNNLTFFTKIFNKTIGKVIKSFNLPLMKRRYYSVCSEETFCNETDKYLNKLFTLFGFDTNKTIVLDQFFDASNPEICFKLVKNSKMIIVDRDPRDVFLISNHFYKGNASFMYTGNSIDDFISSYKKNRINLYFSESVLRLKFEDLVLDYESTKERIEHFIELENMKCEFKYFNPSLSIANVGLFYKYDFNKKEINIIGDLLKEYCFDFKQKDIDLIKEKKKVRMFK